MKSLWNQLREESTPSKNFSEELKARIYENASTPERNFFMEYIKKIHIPKPNLVLKIEKHYSLLDRIKDFFDALQEKTIRLSYVLAGGAVAMILIIPFFSLFTLSPSSASEPSLIRNIEGTVALERMNTTVLPDEQSEVFNNDTLITGENGSAEIIFFEGTVLRIAPNTEIEVSKINPHPFLLSRGGIEVKVKSGMVWVKTFQLSDQGNGIIIKTPNTTIVPERAVFSASYISGKDSLLVFENSVDIQFSGVLIEENKEVFSGEYIMFSPFDEFIPLNEIISDETKNSEWIQSNKQKDISYTSEYLDRIGNAMKEAYIVDSLGTEIEKFLNSNPRPEEVEQLITDINQLLLLSEETPTPEPAPEESENPEATDSEIVQSYSTPSYKRPSVYTAPSATPTPLSIDQDLTQTPETIEMEESEQEIREKQTASEIAEAYQQEQRNEKIEAISESFVNQIESFEFESSRNTQAQNLVDKIPSTPENLDLLQELEEQSPRDVKKIVKQKRIEVEKQILKAEEESLKNSAESEVLPEQKELDDNTTISIPEEE